MAAAVNMVVDVLSIGIQRRDQSFYEVSKVRECRGYNRWTEVSQTGKRAEHDERPRYAMGA